MNNAARARMETPDLSDALTPILDTLITIDPASWATMETPPREWSVHEWIPARQATYLTGPGSAGKSLISQQLCTCIAAGLPFLGVETRQSVAIYVTCEDDADELHRRQKAICTSLGVSLESLSGKLLLVSLTGEIDNALATFDNDGRMTVGAGYRRIAATAQASEAGFIALDNVAHLFAGNENIRNQVAAFCGLLNKLGQDVDASVLFLGHPNKAGSEFSGSTAWENQVRSRLFIETPKEDDGTVPDRDVRILSRGKANYARNGEGVTFRWHQWAFVRDQDLPADVSAQLTASVRASAENAAFLDCLDKANEERRPVSASAPAPNYAPRQFAKMTAAKGIKAKSFELAMQRLFHLGEIENDQPIYKRPNYTWAKGIARASKNPQSHPQTIPQSLPQSVHTTHNAPFPETHKALHPQDPSTTYIKGAPALGSAPLEEVKRIKPDSRSWDELAHGDEE